MRFKLRFDSAMFIYSRRWPLCAQIDKFTTVFCWRKLFRNGILGIKRSLKVGGYKRFFANARPEGDFK